MQYISSLESSRARAVIDHLREIGLGSRLSLPQIAVCGDTSTGKSSLLSAISGVQFPSDTSLKTRCPTQVTMTNGSVESYAASVAFQGGMPAGGETLQKKQPIKDISAIAGKIDELTKQVRVLRNNAEIFSDIIVIEVVSPKAPNLTLIDLPGLVRTTTSGESDQMMIDVRNLVDKYLNEPRTVILAVLQANVDVHNAGILTDALKADPKGERTLGVITKPDCVEEGAHASVADLLNNKVKKLTLGWHMVRLRAQKDQTVSIEEFRNREAAYFNEAASPWSKCRPDQKGSLHTVIYN